MTKRTSPEIASRAGRVMAGYWPSRDEVLQLAASCLSQDEEPAEVVDLASRRSDGDAAAAALREYEREGGVTLDEVKAETSAGDGW